MKDSNCSGFAVFNRPNGHHDSPSETKEKKSHKKRLMLMEIFWKSIIFKKNLLVFNKIWEMNWVKLLRIRPEEKGNYRTDWHNITDRHNFSIISNQDKCIVNISSRDEIFLLE